MKQKALIVISGGLDSVTALYHSKSEYDIELGISFNYSSKHNHREIPFAKYNCIRAGVRHLVLNLDFMNEYFSANLLRSGGIIPDGVYNDELMKQTQVPFRNGIMLSVASGIAESLDVKKIIIGAHINTHGTYPDCKEDFLKKMSFAVAAGTYNEVEITAPFMELKKSEIVQIGNYIGVPFERTWSCYKGGAKHCGICPACLERKEAFREADINDPTEYETPL